MRPTSPLTMKALQPRYRAVIGTGGIGSGSFFALDGNHTLGREESRSGHFLDRRDYCKLHIVSHYVSKLLGSGCLDNDFGSILSGAGRHYHRRSRRMRSSRKTAPHPSTPGCGPPLRVLRSIFTRRGGGRGMDIFPVIPLGMVGADEVGERLLAEMAEVGLDLRYVGRAEERRTLYALCLIYPDGGGGNLTENDSACTLVDAAWIHRAEVEFARFSGAGIALALPEVPLAARRALLALGAAHGFLRVASFTTAEILALGDELAAWGIDVLALNLDEATALADIPVEGSEPEAVVRAALARLSPHMWLTVTAGALGSWAWDGTALAHLPALPVKVVGTAGAGDAHLAGVIAGLAAGLPLAEAHHLGVLTAAVAVQSPHTINFELDREALRICAAETAFPLADSVWALLAPDAAGI